MDHIILAGARLRLETCWIGVFDAAAAKGVLNLPEDVEPVVFAPLGYPADKPEIKKNVRIYQRL